MRKRPTDEYRKSVVNLYLNGKTIKEIESEYGIPNGTFYRWLRKFHEIKMPDGEIMTSDDVKILQNKIKTLEEENLILKKAMTIFTRDSKNDFLLSDE